MVRAFRPSTANATTKKALRILVVEDDADSREMMVQLLRLIGAHSIEAAEDGESGLELMRRERAYDLVFTDVGLPGIDGIEMVDRAVKEGLLPVEHFVICSAHMSPKFDTRARGALCIPKPVDTNQIIDTVRSAALMASDKG